MNCDGEEEREREKAGQPRHPTDRNRAGPDLAHSSPRRGSVDC